MRSKCWRARISVGAISAAWRPASMALAMARSATAVLPEPTSPWSRRSMRLSEARSRPDLVERPHLCAGEPEGEGGRDLRRDPAVAGVAAPRQPPHPAAHEGERELRGQKLVIGEAPPGRARGGGLGRDVGGGSRAMKLVQRLAEGGEAALFEKGPVLPFGQRRHAPRAPRRRTCRRAGSRALRSARTPPRPPAARRCGARRGCGPGGPSGGSRPRSRSCPRRSAPIRPARAPGCAPDGR